MKEVIDDINRWLGEEQSVALATVVQTWGSAPRKAGAKMALTADGRIAGSVSGGCVEGAVFEEGVQALKINRPKLLHFGVADETAWDVGLACGGTIEVFVEPLNTAVTQFIHNLIQNDEAGAAITIIRGPKEMLGRKLSVSRAGERLGTLGDAKLDAQAIAAEATLVQPQRVQLSEEIEVFIDTVRPAPTLIIVGGVHIAIALTSYAKTLGYRTIVIDPRRAFGSDERFPHVDQLVQAWPEKAFAEVKITLETAVALLTHDPKVDDPALKIILNEKPFYIGALGSRKTHAKRLERLRGYGFGEMDYGRIHGPIGLNIGANTPEEIALAIMAEIVRAQRGDENGQH
ncbi:Xanthine and CO dehydrogenases maturation factor, XdhC/CoxF family [hydrothermal vent metagenome]|uniref:Xanthine and CO dehydrogenases maturation factor, XdhC/CoxF family n=1 Tax=hydrothermal vent metagenome TaxID=652676 RepID=A0A3B0VK82_9ZZZZ